MLSILWCCELKPGNSWTLVLFLIEHHGRYWRIDLFYFLSKVWTGAAPSSIALMPVSTTQARLAYPPKRSFPCFVDVWVYKGANGLTGFGHGIQYNTLLVT